jgi:hypothetical protein
VKYPRSTGVAFEEDVYAAKQSVSKINEIKLFVDKLMVEYSRLGQIGVPP